MDDPWRGRVRHVRRYNGESAAARSAYDRGDNRPGGTVHIQYHSHSRGGSVGKTSRYIQREESVTLKTSEGVTHVCENVPLVSSRHASEFEKCPGHFHVTFTTDHRSATPEQMRAAIAYTMMDAFPGHRYGAAMHTDTEHPHAHVIVEARDRDGRFFSVGNFKDVQDRVCETWRDNLHSVVGDRRGQDIKYSEEIRRERNEARGRGETVER